MPIKKILAVLLVIISIIICLPVEAQSKIFENPKNLKVLPENITPKELSNTMRGFALGLGLRCTNCHLGEEGKPLSTFDFASDEKPMKTKARIMMQMVNEINQTFVPKLNQIEKEKRIAVQCVSCHRGQQKTLLIEDALSQALASGKPGAVVDKYKNLREKYYGSHTFDFGISVLPGFSDNLLKEGFDKEALELMELNQTYYPDSYYGNVVRAKALHKNEEYEAAIKAYKKALALNPRATFLQNTIEHLEKKNKQ